MRRFLKLALPAVALLALATSPLTVAGAPRDDLAEKPHSKNMHLIGTSLRAGAVFGPPPAGPGDVAWDTRNTDLAFWGDRVIQGRYDGFRVIDIKSPGNPRELAKFTCISPQGDVGVWGNLVFRSVDSGQITDQCTTDRTQNLSSTNAAHCAPVSTPCIGYEGIQIFDISNLSNIKLIRSVPLDCGSHTHTVVPDLANNRVLLYNSVSGTSNQTGTSKYGNKCAEPFGRFDIVSVPLNAPQTASVIGAADLQVAGKEEQHACHDIGVILGSVNKAACAGSPNAVVLDISNKAAPKAIMATTSPTVTSFHSAVFSVDGDTLILGWEPGGGTAPRCMATGTPLNAAQTQFQTDEMKTIFFHDAVTGALLGRHVLPRPQSQYENCTIHNYNVVPLARRDVLVHGSYQSGIGVVDFTDLNNAYEFAWMDPLPLDPPTATTPGGRTNFRGGDWSSFWYNGRIYESDTRRGLYIYDVSARELAGAGRYKLDYLNPQTQHFSIDR
jgi:hypothetical protein